MGGDHRSFVTISTNQNKVARDAIATSIKGNCLPDAATLTL